MFLNSKGKIIGIIISHHLSYFIGLYICVLKQQLCFFYAFMNDILVAAYAGKLLKKS